MDWSNKESFSLLEPFLCKSLHVQVLFPFPFLSPLASRVWPATRTSPKGRLKHFRYIELMPRHSDSTRPDPTRFKRAALDNQLLQVKSATYQHESVNFRVFLAGAGGVGSPISFSGRDIEM